MDGALVVDLCEKGDQMILEETKKVYKKEKEMKKGRENKGGGGSCRGSSSKSTAFLLCRINANLFCMNVCGTYLP